MAEREMTVLMEELVTTAHLLPPQLERLLETETHALNLLILSNRETHADLLARLRVEDIKKQKHDLTAWEARKVEWRRLRHEHAILAFKS